MRYSFTLTCARSEEFIKSLKPLLDDKLFQGIEIFYPYQLDEKGKETYTNAVRYITKNVDKDFEFVLHLPHGGESNNLMAESEEIFKRFFDAIDYGAKFNVHRFTLHLGNTNGYSQKEYLDKSVSNVRRLCEYAKKYNACIMIENMPSNIEVATSLYEMEYILKNVNMDNVKLIYDTGHGHVYMKDNDKEEEFINTLFDYLYHFHINDNDSTRDAHQRIGLGNIDFKKLFKNINYRYKGLYCLEILYNSASDLKLYLNDLDTILKSI